MNQPVSPANAIPPPEVFRVKTLQVACDGSGEVSPALGHPRVFLRIEPELGFVECGYCDRRFVLAGGPAERGLHEASAGDLPEPNADPAGGLEP